MVKPKWKWLATDRHYLDGSLSDTAIPADQLRTVVREALQNSIDEIDEIKYPNMPTRVRLGVRRLTGNEKTAFVNAANLTEVVKHAEAPTINKLQKGKINLNLSDPSEPLSVFRYEDSRTRGLYGDQFDETSNFFSLLKSSGQTKKRTGGGSHGKGKTVWSRSSRYKSFLIHTITDREESRVFGLCRVDPHELEGQKFRGIGLFSVPALDKGEELEGFASGTSLGATGIEALQLTKELSEADGSTPAGTVFVVPAFIPGTKKIGDFDVNREIIKIVGAEYWPAIVMNLVDVEVEVSQNQFLQVRFDDPTQGHSPQVVAMVEACREAMKGRVQLSEIDVVAEPGLASRVRLGLEVPRTESLLDVEVGEGLTRDFAGGRYELAFVLNRLVSSTEIPGAIVTFRENGQIVEQFKSIPEGIVGFVAFGDAARVVAPDLADPEPTTQAFGDLMIRLLEVAAHDKWSTNGRHDQFDQYFPDDDARVAAGRSFDRLRYEIVTAARKFAGKYDDQNNEIVQELTRYPGFGTLPPPPPEPKIAWSVETPKYDDQKNVEISFLIENKTGKKREVEISVSAQGGDSQLPLPIDRAPTTANWVATPSSDSGLPRHSPTWSYRDDSKICVSIAAKRSIKVRMYIRNDLAVITADLRYTRLKPTVRDLGA